MYSDNSWHKPKRGEMILLNEKEMLKVDRTMPAEFDDIKDDHEAWLYDRRNIAKAQLKKIYDWGNEPCPHRTELKKRLDEPGILTVIVGTRRECSDCWAELEKELD